MLSIHVINGLKLAVALAIPLGTILICHRQALRAGSRRAQTTHDHTR